MKKLRIKTFTAIFLMLSTFLIVILITVNYQNYQREKRAISSYLTRMDSLEISNSKNDYRQEKDSFKDKIIIDYEVYTLILDTQNNIVDIINHSQNIIIDDIDLIGEQIINNNQTDNIKIGNLYFSKYSYNLQNGKFLIIIDNSRVKEKLFSMLKTSLILLILFEIIIFYISKIITRIITKPALDSYNNQKKFIEDASHELKTPLAIIMASADALEKDKSEEKWLNNIKIETEKMNELIMNLLNLSRLENDNLSQKHSLVDLSKLVEKTSLTFESIAFEHELSIKTNIEENISLKCNSQEISQVLSILLDNAIKHSDKKATINVNLFKNKSEIILDVVNKGKEIPKEEREKVFERFYRLDKSRNRKDGRYGLGLAIAKTIIDNHNAKITVFCQDGFTTFRIIFKIKNIN